MSSMIKSLFKKPEKVPDSVEGLKIKLSPAVSTVHAAGF